MKMFGLALMVALVVLSMASPRIRAGPKTPHLSTVPALRPAWALAWPLSEQA